MNPNHNGNILKTKPMDEDAVLPDLSATESRQDETSGPASTQPAWATRADAVKAIPTSRKPILLLGGGLAAAIVLFAITSFIGKAPQKNISRSGPANSQSTVPSKTGGSVTPLMDTVHNPNQSNTAGQLTPADINRTKAASDSSRATTPAPTTPHPSSTNGTLASVPPFESTQQRWEEPKPYGETEPHPQATAPGSQNLLKEASLVFVRKAEPANAAAMTSGKNSVDTVPELSLTPGTRIQARLETQASSAIAAPVVAVVEYTYALGDHVVIPAGARVYGQLQQADRSGAVSIKFSEIELLDGNREKIEAIGTSLELGPIKGSVSGKNTGKNFLVRTASGIGSVAAMLVGNNTSSAFSEDDLIRERIAQNVGNASDTEIMNLAVTNHIVVTVPADTPIYIVFTKREASAPSSSRASVAIP